jgi:transposase-like protein
MPKTRRNFTGTEKVAILREHLVEKVPISDVCEKRGLQPTLFYHWPKKLFEEGASVLERSRGPAAAFQAADVRRLDALEDKLRERNEVLAELLGEYIALPKALAGAGPSPSGLAPKR